jgi:hypothetical protein
MSKPPSGDPHHAQFKDSDRSPEAHRIRSDILFDFVTEPNSFEQNFPRVVSLPYVLVEVTPPLGPAGSIAHQYDSFVRNERQWHLRLPGEFRKQETDVALRTWAVGLLLADGMRFTDAMRDVCEVIDVPEVSQTRFGQDRQGLTQRVPEAKPFVYAREER